MLYILFALFLFSCNEYSVTKVIQTEPELVVYPEFIDFGHLRAGFESGQDSFAIINAGDHVLTINKPTIITNAGRINLDTGLEEEYIIQPGSVLEFNVYYSPATYAINEATISFTSDDADGSHYVLPVIGYGDAPVLDITPQVLDYGDVSIGCDNEEHITIKNAGNLSLIIDDITQMVTQPQDIIMEYGSLPALPWVLDPAQEIDILVSYIPSDISYDESIVRITSNDPASLVKEFIQFGMGDVEHSYSQTHTQEEVAILDVLFVIDNSGSMSPYQLELANQMALFMNIFIGSNANYHLGFVTTDEARLVEFEGLSWIDPTYVFPVYWTQGVIASIGIRGSGNEQGIYNAKAALLASGVLGSEFIRDNATAVIIYVSDEEDHSVGTWTSFTGFFDNFKASPALMRHFAVIGDYPDGCLYPWGTGNRRIQFGSGYYHMTQRYGGNSYSLCASDWGQQMQSLASSVITQNIFQLEEEDPIESTIVVKVNGQIVTLWAYDISTNSVVFDITGIPTPNQTITIEYSVWGCYE